MSTEIYVLPHKGGVGIGKQLQMQLVEAPSEKLKLPNQNWVPGPKYQVAWKSSDNSIASIDQHGQVTGLQAGDVTITATVTWAPHGPQNTFQSKISVGAVVAALHISADISLPVYCTKSIKVQPLDSQGQQLNDRPVTWQSDAPQVASIQSLSPTTHPWLVAATSQGPGAFNAADNLFFHRVASISGKQVGQALITASCEGISTHTTVPVVPSMPTSLNIFPDALILDVQEIGQAMAVVRNQGGCLVPNASVIWETSDPSVATVNQNTGQVRGLKAGTTKLTATLQSGLSTSIDVTIPAVCFISLNLIQVSELDIGAHCEIIATPRSSSGTALANRAVTWSASNNCVSISPTSGYKTTATGKTPGQTIVTALSEGISATCSITVPSVSSITISPSSVNVSQGSSVQFTATPRSSSGTALANRAVTWSASNNCVSISPTSGYKTTATGWSPGDANITASSEGKTAIAMIHVLTLCESIVCAFCYRVENYSDVAVDIYQMVSDASGCSPWTPMATVLSGYAWLSPELVENNAYQVRAVEAGYPVDNANHIKMDSYPFFGGPGIVALFPVY